MAENDGSLDKDPSAINNILGVKNSDNLSNVSKTTESIETYETPSNVTNTSVQVSNESNCDHSNINVLLTDLTLSDQKDCSNVIERSTFDSEDFVNCTNNMSDSIKDSSDEILENSTSIYTQVSHKSPPTYSIEPLIETAVFTPISINTTIPQSIQLPVQSSSSESTSIISKSSVNSSSISTGARPKVSQSTAITTTSTSTVISAEIAGSAANNNVCNSTSTRMKRSPRFSSFDSQASLAEHVDSVPEHFHSGFDFFNTQQTINTSPLVLSNASLHSQDNGLQNSSAQCNILNTHKDGKPVPRSLSNYDMPPSPRNRPVGNNSKEARPTRLALNPIASTLKLDCKVLKNNVNPPPQQPSAFSGFLQSQWPESWFSQNHPMQTNSQNSPTKNEFLENVMTVLDKESVVLNVEGRKAGGDTNSNTTSINVNNCNTYTGETDVAAKPQDLNLPSEKLNIRKKNAKFLSEFLSGDSNMTSTTQRLTDLNLELPSSNRSPQEQSTLLQLSKMCIENEHLQRELVDTRTALDEQTRRVNHLTEKLLKEQQNNLSSHSKCGQSKDDTQSKQLNNSVVHKNLIIKLIQKVNQLNGEIDRLRRENEVLREETGAVGGVLPPKQSTSHLSKPSKRQEISTNLLRAASNAENNLQQLLLGVENLRKMAADIELSGVDIDAIDLNDECDLFKKHAEE